MRPRSRHWSALLAAVASAGVSFAQQTAPLPVPQQMHGDGSTVVPPTPTPVSPLCDPCPLPCPTVPCPPARTVVCPTPVKSVPCPAGPRVRVIIPPPEVEFRESSSCTTCTGRSKSAGVPLAASAAPLNYTTTYTVPYLTYQWVPASFGTFSNSFAATPFAASSFATAPFAAGFGVQPVGGFGMSLGGLNLNAGSSFNLNGLGFAAAQASGADADTRMMQQLLALMARGKSQASAEAQGGGSAQVMEKLAEAFASLNESTAQTPEARLAKLEKQVSELKTRLEQEVLSVKGGLKGEVNANTLAFQKLKTQLHDLLEVLAENDPKMRKQLVEKGLIEK